MGMLKQMIKVKHTIELIVDEDDVEEVANDFRKLYWNHRIVLHSYKSRTKKIPVSLCTYCKTPMFEKTSNNLCHDPHCMRLRQKDFNDKKKIQVDRWKEMMCNQCSDNNDEAFCYFNDDLIHASSTCNGCIYDTQYPE